MEISDVNGMEPEMQDLVEPSVISKSDKRMRDEMVFSLDLELNLDQEWDAN